MEIALDRDPSRVLEKDAAVRWTAIEKEEVKRYLLKRYRSGGAELRSLRDGRRPACGHAFIASGCCKGSVFSYCEMLTTFSYPELVKLHVTGDPGEAVVLNSRRHGA